MTGATTTVSSTNPTHSPRLTPAPNGVGVLSFSEFFLRRRALGPDPC